MSRGVLVGLGGALLGAALTLGTLAIAEDDSGKGAPVGRLTRMEQSGEMHDLLERHREMLQQMQDDATPAMLELMNTDPMWQMLRSEDWARLDEQHQADIDQMLGRADP